MNELNNPVGNVTTSAEPEKTEWQGYDYYAYPPYEPAPVQQQAPPVQHTPEHQQMPPQGGYYYPPQQPYYPPQSQQGYSYTQNAGQQYYHPMNNYGPPQYTSYPPQQAYIPPIQKPVYKWDLADYDAFSGESVQKRRGPGIIIFAVCLLVSLSFSLVALVGLKWLIPETPKPVAEGPYIEEAPTPPPPASSHNPVSVRIPLQNKPQGDDLVQDSGKLSIPQVAERVIPSVVSVVKYSTRGSTEPSGIGSGVILTGDGYIITNAHVVAGGELFKIHLHDGEARDAIVIGADAATDLAVLKIEPEGTALVPAQFGSSDDLRVGEAVVAIGNPVNLSFAGSVTQGIVSALNRQVDNTRYSISYIQTDAAINPGNSGGALVNEYGKVVGINVAKIAAAGYEGMGFAIPMSAATPIIEDILAHGRVTGRVKLGIEGYAVDEYDAQRYGWQTGVMIQSIDSDSDLIGSNVKKGDIITHINGERIMNVPDIHTVMEGKRPGDTLTITLFRKENQVSSEITVEAMLMEDVT